MRVDGERKEMVGRAVKENRGKMRGKTVVENGGGKRKNYLQLLKKYDKIKQLFV